MIPTSSLYPNELDSETNLFVVHDSLRAVLLEDYNPGNTSIKVDANFEVADQLPPTGLITLTEQCSDIDLRAISFFYNEWNADTGVFSGLEILPTFKDVYKPKKITNVTVNVMSMHHNHLKDALIAIQEFCGIKGTEDLEPFGPTLEGRINFLRRLVMQPKAWFTADKRTGNVPLEIEFKNMSFRLGTDGTADEVKITWDFGDQTTSVISTVVSADSMVPSNAIDVYVRDTDGGTIKKIYHKSGIYDVKLTVENNFGKDICVFKDYIKARVKAPDEAVIRFIPDVALQIAEPGIPPNGPFETFPKIRSPINTLIQIEIPAGENPSKAGYSFAGELLNESDEPVDPIETYTWQLSDDLTHPSASQTTASFSVGGIYDCKLRVDTQFGAYRISNYLNVIDIVENTNLWLWTMSPSNLSNTYTARAYEYGLISETYKLTNAPQATIVKNDSFLNLQAEQNRIVMKKEFHRNTGFSPRGTTPSGQGGSALLYWASGRNPNDPVSSEQIKIIEFEGFTGTYVSRTPITRAWNWVNLNSSTNSYFAFGTIPNYAPNSSPTNSTKTSISLADPVLTPISSEFSLSNFLNGAQELQENVADYDALGNATYGNFSTYRTAWKDNTGYIARNDGVGPFFRIKSFYRTEGTIGNQFINIRKLQDIQGSTKIEGQLTDLSAGVYMLNNSGAVSKYDPTNATWSTGGPGVNSLVYRNLQDTSVGGYDNPDKTLLVTSDKDKRAYLSFDFSANVFLKFSEIDLTFSSLGSRPSGDQWIMGIY